jgi:hypothetical protein
MADLSITPASVVPGATAKITYKKVAGATITAGQTVYADASDSNLIKPCDADALASSVCKGIALNGASTGQPVEYQTSGLLTIGATVVLGVVYYVTPNAGGLGAWAEVLAGDYVTLVCIGVSTSVVEVVISSTGGVKV